MLDAIEYNNEDDKCKKLLDSIKNGIITVIGDSNPSVIMHRRIEHLARSIKIPKEELKNLEETGFSQFRSLTDFDIKLYSSSFPILIFDFFYSKIEDINKVLDKYEIRDELLPVTILLLNGEKHVFSGIVKNEAIVKTIKESGINIQWLGEYGVL